MRILEKLKRLRLRLRSLSQRDLTQPGKAPFDNTDAMSVHAGSSGLGGGEMVPPNYVKSYDEGRPRH
jgi:S-adenosylmethionine synthetase